MAPRPPKNTVNHVADAIAKLQGAAAALQEIDLRTTRGELRVALRGAREYTAEALAWADAAIQADAGELAQGRRAS